mgnify:CR=1 FL=1
MDYFDKAAVVTWILERDEKKLKDILYTCIERLIEGEELCVRLPDEDSEYVSVYWDSCGEELK